MYQSKEWEDGPGLRFNWFEYALYSCFYILPTPFQLFFGKPIYTTLFDALFGLVALFAANPYHKAFRVLAFILNLMMFTEVGTYYTMGDGICFRFIANMHVTPTTFQPMVFLLILLVFLIFVFIHLLDCSVDGVAYCYPSFGIIFCFFIAGSSLLNVVAKQKYQVLYPFEAFSSEFIPPNASKHLVNYFTTPNETISFRTLAQPKKHLLIVNFESFESQAMGIYQPRCPQSMPYFSNMTTWGTYCNYTVMAPYAHFTAASLFASECGLPFLVKQAYNSDLENVHLQKSVHCLADILYKFGYKMEFHTGDCGTYSDLDSFLKLHHFAFYNEKQHPYDSKNLDYFQKNLFPKLKQTEQPYYFMLETTNTHFFDNVIEPQCQNRLPRYCPPKLQGYDCDDQLFESFFKKFEEEGLDKTTEVIIYGDHQSHINPGHIFTEPRRLAFFLPYRGKNIISKKVSMYDVGPTALDVLGIDYAEGFPFGRSVFSPEESPEPTADDYQLIYNYFSKQMHFKWKEIRCDSNKSGFCDGNEELSNH